MNLPNLISLFRMFMVPLLVWLLISAQYQLALVVFGFAALSDALDGWLARILHKHTELGAHLDPLADKLLLISTYTTLGLNRLIPTWLVLTVISRDVMILGGLLLAWFMDKPVAIKPILTSKLTTLGQIIFLIMTLLGLSFVTVPQVAITSMGYVVFGLTLISGLAYLRYWFNHMSEVQT